MGKSQENKSFTFGIHAVESLLARQSQRVLAVYFQQGREDARMAPLIELVSREGIQCEWRSRAELDEMVEGRHQGVIAEVRPAQALRDKDLFYLMDTLTEVPLLLVLDGVTDPHNLGACLRTADAAGAHAVIAPKDKSASLNATVRKVACGAAEVVPFIQVTNLARTLRELQQRGVWIIGTAGEAEKSIYQSDVTGPVALVMGAEGKGMRRLTREHCDLLVNLPMAGSVSSLNVSVATGVCLFEIVRQQTSKAT